MKKIAVAFLLLCFTIARAQGGEIDTDRPDQTETPSIVPLHHFQMENGLTHKYEASEGVDRFELPSSLWKYGITKNLELRIITTLLYENGYLESEQGLEPVILGFKHKLWDENGIVPQASVIGQILLPDLATKALKVENIGPALRLLFQNTITDKIDLGYNTGIQWDGDHTKPQYVYTLSPSVEVTKMVKAYVESYGFVKVSRHTEHWIDGGLIFLLSKDIQLDISGGYELTANHGHTHSTYESIGFSFRI